MIGRERRDRTRQRARGRRRGSPRRPKRSRSSTRPALPFRILRSRSPPSSVRTSSTCRRWSSRRLAGKPALPKRARLKPRRKERRARGLFGHQADPEGGSDDQQAPPHVHRHQRRSRPQALRRHSRGSRLERRVRRTQGPRAAHRPARRQRLDWAADHRHRYFESHPAACSSAGEWTSPGSTARSSTAR